MKAKQYAERFNANPTFEESAEIMREFFAEIKRLRDVRQIKTDSSLFSILNELDQKWRTFSSLAQHPLVPDDMFALMVQRTMGPLYDAWVSSQENKHVYRQRI